MKRILPFLLIAVLAFVVGALVTRHQRTAGPDRELEIQRAAWETEKAGLHAELARAHAENNEAREPSVSPPTATVSTPDPETILNQLAMLKAGPDDGRSMRRVFVLLDQLIQIGPRSLPAISRFLNSGRDICYLSTGSKTPRDVKSLLNALVPVSLRLALFDVVRQIGGNDAESLLAETFGHTSRGLEVAYLTELLEDIAPGKYREVALATVRSLLAGGAVSDRTERDYLFGVLQRFNDSSYITTAQAQLVQPNGQVDRSALRYLQQTLGEQSVAVAAQTYQDNRLSEPGSKEPLARLALAFVGANEQAGQLFHTAVMDQALLPDQKRELVEDLNQDGLTDRKKPTPGDLKIIANRYALTQTYLQQDYIQQDGILSAAFREADKDLRNLLQKAANAAANQTGR